MLLALRGKNFFEDFCINEGNLSKVDFFFAAFLPGLGIKVLVAL
jgi:hypothetical protein